jgi:hypothetical protein
MLLRKVSPVITKFGFGASLIGSGKFPLTSVQPQLKNLQLTPRFKFTETIKKDKEMIDKLFRKGFQ